MKFTDKVINRQTQIAIQEDVNSYIVAIDTSIATNTPSCGTGILISFNSRFFILTAMHVVKENYSTKDIQFFYPPNKSTQWGIDKEVIKTAPIKKLTKMAGNSYAQNTPIINRFYSDPIEEDIVFLELDPNCTEIKQFSFYPLERSLTITPTPDIPAYLLGFSRELARIVAKDGFGLFPYFLGSRLVDVPLDNANYNPLKHLLIEYEHTEKSVDPRGLSGGGIWTRLPSGEGNLWTPNIYLIGVQTHAIKKSDTHLLKGTRLEVLFDLINKTAL